MSHRTLLHLTFYLFKTQPHKIKLPRKSTWNGSRNNVILELLHHRRMLCRAWYTPVVCRITFAKKTRKKCYPSAGEFRNKKLTKWFLNTNLEIVSVVVVWIMRSCVVIKILKKRAGYFLRSLNIYKYLFSIFFSQISFKIFSS